jgi:hypothetical protein
MLRSLSPWSLASRVALVLWPISPQPHMACTCVYCFWQEPGRESTAESQKAEEVGSLTALLLIIPCAHTHMNACTHECMHEYTHACIAHIAPMNPWTHRPIHHAPVACRREQPARQSPPLSRRQRRQRHCPPSLGRWASAGPSHVSCVLRLCVR